MCLRSHVFSSSLLFALDVSLPLWKVQAPLPPAPKLSQGISIWDLIGVPPESLKESVVKGGLCPAFGGRGRLCGFCEPHLVPRVSTHTLKSPKGRQAVQPGKRLFYQEQKKSKKSEKEVLFLEKLASREGDQPSLMMIGFLC